MYFWQLQSDSAPIWDQNDAIWAPSDSSSKNEICALIDFDDLFIAISKNRLTQLCVKSLFGVTEILGSNNSEGDNK